MSARPEVVMEFSRGRTFPWSKGWCGNYTHYGNGDIIGVSPAYGWWRPTRSWVERVVRREISKFARSNDVERVGVASEVLEKGPPSLGVPTDLACNEPGPDGLVCRKHMRHETPRHWAKGRDGGDVYWYSPKDAS